MHDGRIIFWGGKTDAEIVKINNKIKKMDKETWGKKYFGYGHIFQIKNFIESIKFNKAVSVSGEDGKETLKIILAIIKSSKTKKRVIV